MTFVLRLVDVESLTAVGTSLTQLTTNDPVAIFESEPEASCAR